MSAVDLRQLTTQAHNLLGRLDHLEQTLAEYRDDHASSTAAAHGLMAVVAELRLPVELHLLDDQVIFAERILPVSAGQRPVYQRLRARLLRGGQGGLRVDEGVSEGAFITWLRALIELGEASAPLATVEATLAGRGARGLQLLAPRAHGGGATTEEHPRWRALHALLRAGRLVERPGPLGPAALAEAWGVAHALCALPDEALRAAAVAPRVEPPGGLRASRRAAAALVRTVGMPPAERALLGATALLLGGRGPGGAHDADLAGLLRLAEDDPLASALAELQQQLHAGPAGWTHPWAGLLAAAELWGRKVADGPAAAAALDRALPPELGAEARAVVRGWAAPPAEPAAPPRPAPEPT
ncbi:MAG: hypothetical protein RL071_3859 [Pseudomonadota bacterium]